MSVAEGSSYCGRVVAAVESMISRAVILHVISANWLGRAGGWGVGSGDWGAMSTWGDVWEGDKAHLGRTETEVPAGQASQTR